MTRKSNKQNVTPDTVGSGPSSIQKQFPDRIQAYVNGLNHTPIISAICIITFLCFAASLNNQFTDWDDKGYILNNDVIKSLSWQGLKTIFTTPVMGNYHPITMLIYAIEYSLAELAPWLYHFDSVLFHVLTVILVYCFVYLLGHNKLSAVVTSLLFGIHPMHAESVAWVAGRKDVLCTLFYFGACIAYIFYTRAHGLKKNGWYTGTLVLFLCSLWSKPVAVTLPIILLLIDYYEQRKWNIKVLAEKIPHFVLAIIFGIVSVKIQHGGGAMDVHKISYTFLERINLAGFALATYLWKAVLPVNLHCFYPFPEKVNGALPCYYYGYPLLIAALAFTVWKFLPGKRAIIFGLLFFLVSIALLLEFVPVGDAIIAERYSYLPYFGLFFIVGHLVSVSMADGSQRYLKYLLLIAYLVWIGYLTNERCAVWYDTYSLWTDEIKSEPVRAPIAYNNLGFYYFEKRSAETDPVARNADSDSAIYFLTRATELKPGFINAVEGLGILYYVKQKFDSSGSYFRDLVRLRPTSESYYDYGVALAGMGKRDSALIEYNKAIALDPKNFKVYLNRGTIYKENNRWGEATIDFDTAININPGIGEIYYQRSFCDTQKGDKQMAIQDVEKAISLGFKGVDDDYYKNLKK